MGENRKAGTTAWQPFTFRGVAAFANATWKRLLAVQIVVALLVASSTVWFLQVAWLPTVHQALQHLPPQGEIRTATLDWTGEDPCLLSEGRCLAFVVDLNHNGDVRSPAHIQVELGRTTIRFRSLFGLLDVRYPKGWIIAVNRGETEPWWGAWTPPILWITFGSVMIGLLLIWSALAVTCAGPVWLIAFFANRQVTFAGACKMAGAALMPGGVLMIAAILAYGFGALDLVQFLFAFTAHIVVGLVFLIASPFFLSRLDLQRKNPFKPGEAPRVDAEGH